MVIVIKEISNITFLKRITTTAIGVYPVSLWTLQVYIKKTLICGSIRTVAILCF